MGETIPFGTREDGLDIFLDHKVEEGYTTETRTDGRGRRRWSRQDASGRAATGVSNLIAGQGKRGQWMASKDKNKKSMEKKPAQKTLQEKRQARKAEK